MPLTNVYFNNFPKSITNEQLLVEDLVIEAMKIHGMEVFYMPRSTRDQIDYLYGEDPVKQYVKAYPIEMYLEDVTGMEGQQDLISKFGLEIDDEMSMLVARRRFAATVPQPRPDEGDLIYVPLVQNFFEITFVEHENKQAMFYTLGKGRGANVYLYALKMKQFVFSNEIIQTGIEEIDVQIRDSYPRTRLTFTTVNGKFLNDEIVYQGANLANANAQALIYDFKANTHADVYRRQGVFTTGTVVGVTSGATANVSVASDTVTMDDAFEDIIDNNRLEQEADSILDWTEINPFGEA